MCLFTHFFFFFSFNLKKVLKWEGRVICSIKKKFEDYLFLFLYNLKLFKHKNTHKLSANLKVKLIFIKKISSSVKKQENYTPCHIKKVCFFNTL